MRILFLTPIGAIGGAERVLLDMIASLRRAESGPEVHVIAGGDGPLLPALDRAGATVTPLPIPRSLARVGDSALIGTGRTPSRLLSAFGATQAIAGVSGYALRLRRTVNRLRPDIIHSNGNKFHLLSRLALGHRWPVIWHLHDFLGERPLIRRLARRAAPGVDCAIAVSEAVARDARSILGRTPIEVIANGVDVERFSPGPGDGSLLDRLAGLPPASNAVRIGLVATYARWKGQDLFLEAAARVPAEIPVRVFIIGGPIFQTAGSQFTAEELRRRIAELGLADRVGLIPFQNSMPDIYRALDLAVHASRRPEPFGLTIAEVMACGRPVIVSLAGGASELVRHDQDAFGVEPNNADQLAAAIATLAADPGRRERIAQSARRTALERFDRNRLGPSLLAVYRRLARG